MTGGSERADSLRIGVVAAEWNQDVVDRLLDGALRRLAEIGIEQVTVVRVPGALEIPVAARRLADVGCDAVVALGTVIKGETDHYDIVVRESAHGISMVAVDTGVPVANGILAVHDYAQAMARAGAGHDNKGAEAVDAAVATANALRSVGEG